MNIDSIANGYVIDHITAGKSMEIYRLLGLSKTDIPVALITNAVSNKMGRKDIMKIDADIEIDLDVIGFVDPGATVCVIRGGKLVEKRTSHLPESLVNVIKCKNPRCITSIEQELDQHFRLTNRETKTYRCEYCEAEGKLSE